MKFVCLGYFDENKWKTMSPSEQHAMIEECFSYDDKLRDNGTWVDGGEALQSVQTAKTLRGRGGKVIVTDGPFAETKEQLGGLGVLEARDMDQAVEIMSNHPGTHYGGPFEIRPVDEEVPKRGMASDAKRCGEAGVAPNNPDTMKFACLGYMEQKNWDAVSKSERDAMIEQCIAFDEARRKDGHWRSGIKLQGAQTAKTVRSKGDKVMVTDGPFAETKEQLGGVVVLGIEDMKQAVELLLKHPALQFGVSIEIRPIDKEMNARWEAREFRRTSVGAIA